MTQPPSPVQPLFGIKPPLILLALIGIGVGIHLAVPERILPGGAVHYVIGVPIALAGVALALSANLVFQRVGTDDRFAKPTSVIVQSGPFRWSRNPMYLGMVLITLGVMLALNSAWSLLVLPALLLYLQFGVIQREEDYLGTWFGQEFLDYKGRVRRWI